METIIIYDILLASLVATTVMTIFSHVVSIIRNREFNEAQLLNKFIDKTKCLPEVNNENAVWGWIIHYIIGIIVAIWIYCVFLLFAWPVTIWIGGILGFIAGVVGAVGWLGLFTFHANAPETDVKEFIIQLLMAHCIFGATIALVLGIFS